MTCYSIYIINDSEKIIRIVIPAELRVRALFPAMHCKDVGLLSQCEQNYYLFQSPGLQMW